MLILIEGAIAFLLFAWVVSAVFKNVMVGLWDWEDTKRLRREYTREVVEAMIRHDTVDRLDRSGQL